MYQLDPARAHQVAALPSATDLQAFAQQLSRPLAIGNRTCPGRLVLAPMSKLGNVAFRELLAGFGHHSLLFSEMSSARAVKSGTPSQTHGFKWRDAELPHLVCQLFGDDPADMAAAAGQVEARGFFGVDINFGCSVAAVCNHGCGAQLLKTPDRAEAIVKAIRRAIEIPLFVKFRTGWKDDPNAAAEMARRFEAAGADALTFHPRVAPDRRTRPPKWDYIRHVKKAVSIPVLGNGNVFSPADAVKMLATTGCDGIALGRLAVARPWIFSQWSTGQVPGTEVYRQTIDRYAELLRSHFESRLAWRRMNRFLAYYAANFKFGHHFYGQVCGAKDWDDLARALDRFFNDNPEIRDVPQINLMR